MKTVLRSYAMPTLVALTLFAASCSKEKSSQSIDDQTAVGQTRSAGAVADDPALQAKVPLIVSPGFLNTGINGRAGSFDDFAAKGKPDNVPPTISFVAPSNNASVSGTISVQVKATDNVKVTSVSLSIDGKVVSTSTTLPFTNTWNSGTVTNGNHTVTVTAKDGKGNSASASIQVSVNNVTAGDITAPSVDITSPVNGTTYEANTNLNISSSASDNVGVASLSISINNVVVSTSASASTSYSWNTSTAASGFHTITATAKDAAGNQSVRSVTVTINTVVVPPPVSSGVHLVMPPVGNQGGEGACVPFAIGYAARSAEQYYRTNASTYSFSTNVFSPEFLYNQIKFSTDCSAGTAMQTALDFIVTKGISTFQSMPYSSTNGCSLLPTAVQTSEALNYKINGYSKIYYTDRAAIKSMIEQKHPVIITILADNSFISAKTGFLWKAYSGSGMLAHCLVICGYDDSKNAYKIFNSWGTTWGDAGYSWIDYNFFETGGRTAGGGYCYVIN
ncbi:Ig-like domain-containing protein [Lacibacter sp. H407]|uniref:Ig-like domain-containing protein n=1 Tax=Lacibacter sp. H407 TaxID=3133423 RepID=UPI0030BF01E9